MIKKSDKRRSADDGDLDSDKLGKGHDPADDDDALDDDGDTGQDDDDSDVDDGDDQDDDDGAGAKGTRGTGGTKKPKETNEERLQRELDEAKAQRRTAERELRKERAKSAKLVSAAGSSDQEDPDEIAARLQTIQSERDTAFQRLRENQKRDAVQEYLTEKKLLGDYAGSVKYIVPTLELSDEDLDGDLYDEEALQDAAALACRDFVKENPRTRADSQGSGGGGAPPRNNGGGAAQTEAEMAEMRAKYPRTYARLGVRG